MFNNNVKKKKNEASMTQVLIHRNNIDYHY